METIRKMRNNGKKLLSVITAFAVALTMGACMVPGVAFAEEQGQDELVTQVTEEDVTEAEETTEPELLGEGESGEEESVREEVALSVYYGDVLLKNFTMEELKAIAIEDNGSIETGKKYSYSCYNTYPTYSEMINVWGPSVESIIGRAAEDSEYESELQGISGDRNRVIDFESADGLTCSFVASDILGERYYFAGAKDISDSPWESVAVATGREVPAMISLHEEFENSEGEMEAMPEQNLGKLVFGQSSLHEQNKSAFISEMTSGGIIRIGNSYSAGQWNEVNNTTSAENRVAIGEGISFDLSDLTFDKNKGERYWVFFTTDGTDVDGDSAIYNYNNFNHGTANEKFNSPVFDSYGTAEIKTRVMGYGKRESAQKTITVEVVLGAPKARAYSSGYTSNVVTWPEVPHATKYLVHKNGKLFKTIEDAGQDTFSVKDTKLKTGVKYTYKVQAIDESEEVESDVTTVYSTPKCSAPKITAVSSGTKRLTVKWTRVSGANGYVLYRSTKPDTGFKAIKTIKSSRTVKYTNYRLKKKHKYYYKIKAYRTVSGKKRYGDYSAVRGGTTK